MLEAHAASGTGPVMDAFWRDVWGATMRSSQAGSGPQPVPDGQWAPTSLKLCADVLPLIRSNLSPGLQVLSRSLLRGYILAAPCA